MGTSLSGLTPATTFDGLLKTSDNEPLDGTPKTIGDGSGVDSQLKIATNKTQIGNIEFVSSNVITTVSPSTNLRITSGGVGINSDYSTPTANTMLHIKGSGATSATTSLLVQNSDGDEILKVTDDKSLILSGATTIDVGNGDPTANNGLYLGDGKLRISNYFNQGIINVPTGQLKLMTSEGVGIGTNYANTSLTAMLSVKGLGATSATTALLVQNSAGATGFQVDDGGNIGLGNPPLTGIKVAQTSGAARFRDLYFGNIGSSAINNNSLTSINWNGSTGIGIANSEALAATAMLHIKGSGNDSTTTSLLVQNSDGDDVLKVGNDGGTTIKSFGASNALVVDSSLGTSAFSMYAAGGSRFRMMASSITTRFQVTNTNGFNFVGNAIFTSGAFDTAAARLHVKGSGATSATTALLVENSAGTDMLKVNDAGEIGLGASPVTNTRAFIKSAGSTPATNAFLVQNSSSTNLFKVQSDGKVYATNLRSSQYSSSVELLSDVDFSGADNYNFNSTTGGFLPPRMTTTERDAISSPASGLMVYNTTTNKAQCYNGTAWQDLF